MGTCSCSQSQYDDLPSDDHQQDQEENQAFGDSTDNVEIITVENETFCIDYNKVYTQINKEVCKYFPKQYYICQAPSLENTFRNSRAMIEFEDQFQAYKKVVQLTDARGVKIIAFEFDNSDYLIVYNDSTLKLFDIVSKQWLLEQTRTTTN